MTLHEIILRITGRANVKPAVDKAKRDIQRGFAASDLLTGRGGEQAMKALRGGLVTMGLRIGYEVGTKINAGITAAIQAGGIGNAIRRAIGSMGVRQLLSEEDPARRSAAARAEDNKANEQLRVENLNRDLENAMKRADREQKIAAARASSEKQVAAAAGARSAAAEADIAGRESALAAEVEQRRILADAISTEEDRVKALRQEYEIYRNVSSGTGADMERLAGMRAQFNLVEEANKRRREQLADMETGIELQKIELDTQRKILNVTEEKNRLDNVREQQSITRQERQLANLERARDAGGTERTGTESALGIAEVEWSQGNPAAIRAFRARGLMDASIDERVNRHFNRRADRAAVNEEREATRKQKRLEREADAYNERFARMTQGKSADEIEAIRARLAGGRGARAAKLREDALKLEQDRIAQKDLERKALLADIEAAKALLDIKQQLSMPQ